MKIFQKKLKRLSELEPERLEFVEDPIDVLADVYATVSGETINTSSHDYNSDRYIVQGVVQEGIESRRWHCSIHHEPDGIWYVEIWDRPHKKLLGEYHSSSLPFALLNAYVESLETVN